MRWQNVYNKTDAAVKRVYDYIAAVDEAALKKLNEDENNKGDTGNTPPPTYPGPQTGGTTPPKPQPKPKPPQQTPPKPKPKPKPKKIFKFGTWIKNSQGQVYRVGLFRTVTRHDGILEGPTDVNAKSATVEQIAKAYIDYRNNKKDYFLNPLTVPTIKEIENFAPIQKDWAKFIWSKISRLLASGYSTPFKEPMMTVMPASQALKLPNMAMPFTAIKGYDTGGYTGDWSSTQGKLAVLHQKELVLNKEDTANMLEMIAMVREMQQQELQFRLSSLNNEIQDVMKQNAQVEKIKTQQKLLEQSVAISASFPSVNSKKEIEEALSELMNKATQIALKYKKN